MGQRTSRLAGATPSGVPGRRGTCRLCLEEDTSGDLIAPCLCRGTSKWIHRECLNHWRVSGSNPRALTNCCECGFQYRLKLKRNDALSSESEVRRRQLMRRLASQTLLWFVGLQLFVCGLACLVRAADRKESLVRLFGFAQVQGHAGPGTFLEALKYHKITYYVSGVILLLAITGLAVSVGLLVACCRGGGTARQARRDCGSLPCAACTECICPRHSDPFDTYLRIRLCEDCGHCCVICCSDCSRSCCSGACLDAGGRLPNIWGSGRDCKQELLGVLVALIVIVIIVFVLVGVFAAVVALVTSAQKAGQEFAKVQQLRAMATEFEVQDLADPGDLGEAEPQAAASPEGLMAQQAMTPDASRVAPSAPPHTQEELRAQATIEQELAEIFGGSAPLASQQALRGYGVA